MARETRAATGNSKPRIFEETPVVAPKKRAPAKPKANTTAKRAPKKAAAGSKPVGVTKQAAPKKKAAPAVKKDKVEGKIEAKAEKAVAAVTGDKPKKVCCVSFVVVCLLDIAYAAETRRRLLRVLLHFSMHESFAACLASNFS
jgi:hypothetical protein